jgi:hypothetical protein
MGRVQLHDHSFHCQGGPTRMLHSTVFSHDIFIFKDCFTSIFGRQKCVLNSFANVARLLIIYLWEWSQNATTGGNQLSHQSLLA